MSAAVLEILHCGAVSPGAAQPHAVNCLGGNWASSFVRSLEAYPYEPRIRNVRVVRVHGVTEPGNGTIRAASADTLTWTPPGGTEGAAVTVTNGATATLFDNSGAAWCLVQRTTADDLSGEMVVGLVDIYHNAIGLRDWTNAERVAVTPLHGAVIVRANGAAVTSVKIWLEDGDDAIALETPVSGAIQEIANDTTAPTAVTFSSPTTEGTALTIASMADGDLRGLWIKRSPAAAAIARKLAALYVKYTTGGNTHQITVRGQNRCDGVASFNLYEGNLDGGQIDISDAGTYDSVTNFAGPTQVGSVLAEGTTWYAVTRINKWGLESQPVHFQQPVGAGGVEGGVPPTTPQQFELRVASGGNWNALGAYYPAVEGTTPAERAALRANEWTITYTSDGSTPVAGVDDEIEVSMGAATQGQSGRVLLDYTDTAVYLDGTEIKAIARATRDDGVTEVHSDPTAVATVTINRLGPDRLNVRALQGVRAGLVVEPEVAPGTVVIDAGTSTEWRMTDNSTSLYVGSTLVLRAILTDAGVLTLYIPSEFDLTVGTVSGAGTNDPVEVVSATELYLTVNGIRVIAIDLSGNEITVNGGFDAVSGVLAIAPEGPAWRRYAQTTFQIWNPATEIEQVAFQADSSGNLVVGGGIVNTLNAAAVAALEAA